MAQLDEIRELVATAKAALESYNEFADKLAALGVTIELDTSSSPHGVVGIGKVEARKVHASFMLELD